MRSSIAQDRITDSILRLYLDYGFYSDMILKRLFQNGVQPKGYSKQAHINEIILHEVCHVCVDIGDVEKPYYNPETKPFSSKIDELQTAALAGCTLELLKAKRWSRTARARETGISRPYASKELIDQMSNDPDILSLAVKLERTIIDKAVEATGTKFHKILEDWKNYV